MGQGLPSSGSARAGARVTPRSGAPPCSSTLLLAAPLGIGSGLGCPAQISIALGRVPGKIFVADPNLRITIQGIKQHPWFLTALPPELAADDYLL